MEAPMFVIALTSVRFVIFVEFIILAKAVLSKHFPLTIFAVELQVRQSESVGPWHDWQEESHAKQPSPLLNCWAAQEMR